MSDSRAAALSSDEAEFLELARDWKAGRLLPVHPTIAHRFNQRLVAAGEDPVPFRRSTSLSAPAIPALIRAEYECASDLRDDQHLAA